MATDVSSKEYRVRQNSLELECQLCKSSVHRHVVLDVVLHSYYKYTEKH